MDAPAKVKAFLIALVMAASSLPAGAHQAGGDCATTVAALIRLDGSLHRTWDETSMSDGKPLVLSLAEQDGELHLVFDKTAEGLWARGRAAICRRGAVVEARLTAVQLGPAAPWLLRSALGRNPVFVLTRRADAELQIATPGWSGSFRARP